MVCKFQCRRFSIQVAIYILSISGDSGTAGNSLAYHDKQTFSTTDQDSGAAGENCVASTTNVLVVRLVPRLLPYRKTGREPERSDHVPRDVLCAWFMCGFDNRIIAHAVRT